MEQVINVHAAEHTITMLQCGFAGHQRRLQIRARVHPTQVPQLQRCFETVWGAAIDLDNTRAPRLQGLVCARYLGTVCRPEWRRRRLRLGRYDL